MLNLLYRIRKKRKMRFEDAFSEAPTREEVVTYFLAVLELLKLGQMHVKQDTVYGGIELLAGKAKQKKEPKDLTDLTGEVKKALEQ